MDSSNKQYQAVVVGAGINGLCTAYSLAKQGIRTLLLEQFTLLHGQGSSHSHIRITRSAYRDYVYMQMAYDAKTKYWPELEKQFNQKLLFDNDFISFGDDEIFESYKKFVLTNDTPSLRLISGQQAEKRFPALKLAHLKEVIIDTNAGVLHASKIMKCLASYLKSSPFVTIRQNCTVKKIDSSEHNVEITVSDNSKYYGQKCVVTAGRWIPNLFPELSNLFKINKQTISYIQVDRPKQDVSMGPYPCWMASQLNKEEFYSLPAFEEDWIKMAQHDNHMNQRGFTQQQKVQRTLDFARRYFNYKILGVQKTETCYYTSTKEEDFLIDFMDDHRRLLATSTCSGHSFKFGPVTGRILAELLMHDRTSVEIFERNRHKFSIHFHQGVNLMA